MLKDKQYEYVHEDYSQSANTLFHFMDKPKYLKESLCKKALIPRYCKEDIKYLGIQSGKIEFGEMLVLGKCFCDIPFHKLTERFHLDPLGENYEKLTEIEKNKVKTEYTHPDFYGKYAIAFSKNWGEKNDLQPIHYLNENSQFAKSFSYLITQMLNFNKVSDLYSNDILNRLAFVKPIRGIMRRKNVGNGNIKIEVDYCKNFHDEQEWRYVPDEKLCSALKIQRIIANKNIVYYNDKRRDELYDLNKTIESEYCSSLWLKYEYGDIRYIIVPDSNARIDIIRSIMDIPENKFNSSHDVSIEKQILTSKILVLEEIRKDW